MAQSFVVRGGCSGATQQSSCSSECQCGSQSNDRPLRHVHTRFPASTYLSLGLRPVHYTPRSPSVVNIPPRILQSVEIQPINQKREGDTPRRYSSEKSGHARPCNIWRPRDTVGHSMLRLRLVGMRTHLLLASLGGVLRFPSRIFVPRQQCRVTETTAVATFCAHCPPLPPVYPV
jgi:hypothetical protein